MKYRIVELSNGMFQCQYRVMPWVWHNSTHAASSDLRDQVGFMEAANPPKVPKPHKPKIVRVVGAPAVEARFRKHGTLA